MCYSGDRWHRCLWCSGHCALALKFAKTSVLFTNSLVSKPNKRCILGFTIIHNFQVLKPNKNCILSYTVIAWSKDCPAHVIKHGPWLGTSNFSVTSNITILFIYLFGYWYGFLILLIHHCIICFCHTLTIKGADSSNKCCLGSTMSWQLKSFYYLLIYFIVIYCFLTCRFQYSI